MTMKNNLLHKSRRRLVRIVSFTLAAMVALAGAVAVSAVTAARYRTQLEYTYERGLSELSEHLDKIETTLTKGIYTGTAAGATNLAMNLWSESGSAKACLAQIPTYGTDLENTYKFLSQVGEYSLSLAKKLQTGNAITTDEHKKLLQLSNYAKELSSMIAELCGEMSQNGRWKQQIENVVEQQDTEKAADALYSSLQNMEESLSDYPTLLYDGPFSEHILQAKPLLIKDLKTVQEADARSLAAKTLQKDVSSLGEAVIQEKGTIPSYIYYVDAATIAITQQGGYVNYFDNNRDIGDTALQYEECVAKAKEYLKNTGLGTFKESYYTVSEGVCLINFAFMEKDVVCYTDLIKIGVALDNGEIVSYNAQGFIMNHTKRTLNTPKHTVKDAQKVLSSYLTVKSSQPAIIPLNSREPQICYEFLCQGKEQDEILVYINANTLEEEELLIVLKTDGGTLTV